MSGYGIREAVLRLLVPRRRFNCQDQERESWELRADSAAALLARYVAGTGSDGNERLRVGDFGCGNERLRGILERRLEVALEYVGYDLHPQSRRVRRIDLNREMPTDRLDAVFCLGLLEYLRDVPAFVLRLAAVCRLAVVSYVLADAGGALPPSERRQRGWLNDYTQAELETLFGRAGFALCDFAVIDEGLSGVWLWEGEVP